MRSRIVTSRLLLVASTLTCAAACSSAKTGVDAAIASYTKIDDMEEGGESIEWMPPPGLVPGIWNSFSDCTQPDTILPIPGYFDPNGWSYATLPTPEETLPGILSTHAARLRTTAPLLLGWGAAMGFDLGELPNVDGGVLAPNVPDAGATPNGSPSCTQPFPVFSGVAVDLSAYAGITFWAMADPAGAQSVLVELNDRNTDPRAGICNAADPSSTANCYNGFATSLTLTGTLTQYTINFSNLRQDPTWGYRPDPNLLDLQHIYKLVFLTPAPNSVCQTTATSMCPGGQESASFDLWIDDLYFVNK
jgi:hypothetical protein